jgi:hypothetical protein
MAAEGGKAAALDFPGFSNNRREVTTPEGKAPAIIDAQLGAAGWVVQDRDQLDRHASLGVAVREYPMTNGPTDYLLLIDGKACGTVEAKPEGFTLSGVAGWRASFARRCCRGATLSPRWCGCAR